ncbi:16S rRNA (cytosine(967)-C(5))-methyltransferase RsmB [Paraburkholderia sp. D15]|uniref:16S rRNA (cytosine(967)-C(5))-methyltransferase RsmB n=1 Tax=Paraburkholderia sp. D15 TaxID=2880218 RepID=UPI002479BCEB|nr:16S rRNA (cytosine(967)-C(5))-methyltransferase RsmB [Paraburkholderia sp. D15]WGS50016.1 16S rRNA (cytosine(967)-C(5))-methyltransferase RsmB [Paraburkholderia sp. D15]WKF57933.1 Ribosomal RNA small subunit methyltransferase B [Paraburkholderia busanensis]
MTPKPSSRSATSSARPRESRLSLLHLAPESLGFALDCAAQAVGAVRTGAALPAALQSVFASAPEGSAAAARGAVQDIAYRTMRRLATAEWLIAKLVKKAPPPHVGHVLACAFALLIDDEASAAYTPFTVVDQAVSAISARREFAFAKGLVNAVLRNFLRDRDTLLAAAQADEVARWNYPSWWIDAIKRAWPDAWQAVLAAGNTHGPLTLRVNARHSTVDAYLQTLRNHHIAATRAGDYAVRLATPMPVDRIPGFADGVVSVQDAGAQLAAQLLNVRDGMRVLDACAAPGGKTGHLLELANLQLVALESDASRARRIGENLQRLKLEAEVRIGDAGSPAQWHDDLDQPFDRILADVPCSASGIVRRHPDIRWLRRETDIAALVAEQRRILGALWPLVKPGGELLYVTCSIFPEEGELQAQWFGDKYPDAVRLDAPGQLLPAVVRAPADTSAGSDAGPLVEERADANSDHDGFFYARFQKR